MSQTIQKRIENFCDLLDKQEDDEIQIIGERSLNSFIKTVDLLTFACDKNWSADDLRQVVNTLSTLL